jgi:acyl-CoA thioester hydrolase
VEGFEFVHRETVRFRDVDAKGHVNNAVFLTYMESARTAFLVDRGLAKGLDDLRIIVARVEADFRSPASWGETVEIGVRPGTLGTKSFELEYELRAADRLVAEGRSVQVAYDYETEETITLPQEWRKLLSP